MKKTFIVITILGCLFASVAKASTSDIETAIMNKNYDLAKVFAEDILKKTNNSQERTQAEYYLGLSQLRLGQYAEARNIFQKVMTEAGSQDLYDRAALGVMESLYMPGFYQDALKSSNQLLRKSPHSSFLSLIYLKVARIHLKLTEWGLAKEYLQKVIKEFPQSLEAPIAQKLMEEKEYFAVQVGSFLDQDKALHLMEELKSKGQYAYIVETTRADNKKFYRVRVGQIAALSNAQTLETKLSHLGYPTLIYP